MRRWLSALLVLLSNAPAVAQDQEKAPYVERVEVRVRSVLVFITDAKGKPLATPPAPPDLRVIEDGKPAEVLAVEPARQAESAPPPGPGAPAGATAAATVAREAAELPQYLYLDTTSLRQRSIPRIVKMLDLNLNSLLANGPLEVVVADPAPRVVLPSTHDAAAIRAALAKLPTAAVGKQIIFDARRDSVTQMIERVNDPRRPGISAFRADPRVAIRQELLLITTSLEYLDAWAATLPYDRASIVYLGNDGFDGDLTEVYRQILLKSPRPEDVQVAMQLQLEFGRDAENMTSKAADVLGGRGATAVVLALGGTDADFATSASNQNTATVRQPYGLAPTFYFNRPNEPLLAVADRTGGQVVTAETRLPRVLDEIGGAYLVSFRSHSPADGSPHPLEITSASTAYRVRAPRAVLAATPQAASAGQAVRALSSPFGRRLASRHRVRSWTPLRPRGAARRAAWRSRPTSSRSPRRSRRSGPGGCELPWRSRTRRAPRSRRARRPTSITPGRARSWSYEANISWPPDASRVAVTIEELKTGARGSAVAELPED